MQRCASLLHERGEGNTHAAVPQLLKGRWRQQPNHSPQPNSMHCCSHGGCKRQCRSRLDGCRQRADCGERVRAAGSGQVVPVGAPARCGLQNLPGACEPFQALCPSICGNHIRYPNPQLMRACRRPPRSQHPLSPAITQQPSTTCRHPSNHPRATHSAGPGPCQRRRPPAHRSMHPSCPERSPQSTAGGRDGGSISGSRERSLCKQQGGWHRQACAAVWTGSTRRDGGSMSSGTEHTCSATGRWQGSGSLRVHAAKNLSPPSNSSHSRPPRQRCRPPAPAWCRTAPSGCRCAPGQARRWAPVGGVRSRRG